MESQKQLPASTKELRRLSNGDPSLRVARPYYTETPSGSPFDPQPNLLLEYWDILRRRQRSVIIIAFLGFALSILLTLPQTPLYQARGSLEIQNINENFLNMRNVSPTASDGNAYSPEVNLRTQVRILQSESVLERVVAKLGLEQKLQEKEKSRIATWRGALGLPQAGATLSRDQALRRVATNLKVRVEPSTRLVEITYDSTDPQLAADVINSLTAEFVQANLDARWKSNQQTGQWLAHQMESVRIKLEKSEDELQSYANVSGLLFTSEKENVSEEKLRELQQELSKAEADRITKQSSYELAASARPESLPEVVDDPTLKEYQVKLTDLRRQYAELSASLTPSHPNVKKVQAQIAAVESALERKRNSIIDRTRNEFTSTRRRESLLAASYASQARVMSEQAAKVAHYNILKREVDSNRQLYDSMLRSVQEATMSSALSASNVRVVDSAQPPSRPYRPNLLLNAVLGVLGGSLFGLVFAVIRERSDQSIQAPGETERYLDLPELGVIPCVAMDDHRRSRKLLKGKDAAQEEEPIELLTSVGDSAVADSFRAILTSIMCCGENGNRPRIIVLTSAGPSEGKTTVACNLALALAEIGRSVLLVDADLRKGRLHEIFRMANSWGLSDLLQGRDLPTNGRWAAVKTSYPNLFVLPGGPVGSSISHMLHSTHTEQFLQAVRQEFHTVIIDTPPMLHMPDARVLGKLADGVVLVVRSAQTGREAAAAASRRLNEDGTRVLGTVLNEWDPKKTNRFGYGYGYDYCGYENKKH